MYSIKKRYTRKDLVYITFSAPGLISIILIYIHIQIYIHKHTDPGPGYLHSKDGVVWLWSFVVNLHIYFFPNTETKMCSLFSKNSFRVNSRFEEHFSMQRRQGWSSYNPTLEQFQDQELVTNVMKSGLIYQWQRCSRTDTRRSRHLQATNNSE